MKLTVFVAIAEVVNRFATLRILVNGDLRHELVLSRGMPHQTEIDIPKVRPGKVAEYRFDSVFSGESLPNEPNVSAQTKSSPKEASVSESQKSVTEPNV